MKTILKYIDKLLTNQGINYSFMRWEEDIVYPYFVGEYNEISVSEENRMHEYSFTITGFTRGTWNELEEAKSKIEKVFESHTTILENGSGVVISYNGAFPIPIDDGELKRIQINLTIQEWRVK